MPRCAQPLTLWFLGLTGAADRTLDIPITGAVLPAGLLGMYVHVTVAGQTTEMQYLPAANVTYQYQWDGLDAYGDRVWCCKRPLTRLPSTHSCTSRQAR